MAEVESRIDDALAAADEDDRDDDGYDALDVFDDFTLAVDASLPPTAKEITERTDEEEAAANEAKALARLASCKSTIVVDYYARISEKRDFLGVLKLVLSRVGSAVVENDNGFVETSERWTERRKKDLGDAWESAPVLGDREAPPSKKPAKTRSGKPGEVEAAIVYDKLLEGIHGGDPFARAALREGLGRASKLVQEYAGALAEDGAKPDAAIAKEIGCKPEEATLAREELTDLLEDIYD